jgi:hypothetical protein
MLCCNLSPCNSALFLVCTTSLRARSASASAAAAHALCNLSSNGGRNTSVNVTFSLWKVRWDEELFKVGERRIYQPVLCSEFDGRIHVRPKPTHGSAIFASTIAEVFCHAGATAGLWSKSKDLARSPSPAHAGHQNPGPPAGAGGPTRTPPKAPCRCRPARSASYFSD